MSNDEPPQGFEHVWVPVSELPHGGRWDVLPEPDESHGCRWTVERMRCGRPSVVRLDRSHDTDRFLWWHYCERHMFGRRLRDGVLESRVLREVSR